MRPFRFRRIFACCLAGLAALASLPGAALAEPALLPAPYAQLEHELDARIDFETLPRRAEPGINLDAPMRDGGAWLGERLAGQRVSGPVHDRLAGTPALPLSVRAGAPGASLSLAYHRGFGSTALFALGPAGFPALKARGEGAVAVLFDHGQRAIGLRIHSDYPSLLGQARPQGTVTLTFYRADGHILGQIHRRLSGGVNELGFRRAGDIADIAAFTLANDDPGGIALDDILYQTAPMAF